MPLCLDVCLASGWLTFALTDCTFSHSAGGIFIVGGNGKIEINNTFEERLRLLQTSALPTVRKALFGPNPNRKFFD